MNGNPDDLLRQLHESRKLKTAGIVLFDFAHLDSKYTNVLLTNAFTPSTPSQTTLSKQSTQNKKDTKEKKKRKYLRNMDCMIHLPNRICRSILGKEFYESIKEKIKWKG